MARTPELVTPGLPTGPITMPGDKNIPTYDKHLYAESHGKYRATLGSWEAHVLSVESARPGFVAWYRNPTGGQRALRVPYDTGNGYGKLYPDFVVLHEDDEDLRASIVDPHGHHLADAADKLRGLAAYAAEHGDEYARIVGVIQNAAGDFRMLDLKDATVRESLKAVRNKGDIEQAFADHGAAYS
ncbi:MAG: hypothetical protein FJW94_14465 [Actinobacteria bacterium]|nr:hypothetical protein [Actinomycetota bacterium]